MAGVRVAKAVEVHFKLTSSLPAAPHATLTGVAMLCMQEWASHVYCCSLQTSGFSQCMI